MRLATYSTALVTGTIVIRRVLIEKENSSEIRYLAPAVEESFLPM
jgi:hypothetical protein